MKYYIIAGEASGDLHGSNLIRELRKKDPSADIRCWGGDLMEAAGGRVVKHYKDLAFMGFTEVLMNLSTILRNLRFCKEDIQAFHPDVLILIDYPGFNLRIASWAHARKLKVVYYISPQVWAWKESRVKTIRECVDKMLVILPFEKDFYKKWNFDVEYVGHPLVEVIEQFEQEKNRHNQSLDTETIGDRQPLVALLPGSRKQEILKKLPIMLSMTSRYPHYDFVVAQAPGLDAAFYRELLEPFPNVRSVSNQTYDLLLKADAACVTSGTATLETALFDVPEVICYKGSPVSYEIAKRLIRVKYISLVNLIMDRPVVKELIQHELTTQNLSQALDELLNDPERRRQMRSDYRQLKDILSQGGHASANAARSIIGFLQASASSK